MKETHLSRLTFQNRKEIRSRGIQQFKIGKISQKALELGEKYRFQIESGYIAPCSVKWISQRVGYGVFAKESISQDSYIGEYTGVVKKNIRTYFAPLNNYCYEYPVPDHLGRNYVIDATKGNLCRLINHSKRANLEPQYAFFDGFFHLIFLSLRKIEKGEQLLYDYGPTYWYIRSPPEEL